MFFSSLPWPVLIDLLACLISFYFANKIWLAFKNATPCWTRSSEHRKALYQYPLQKIICHYPSLLSFLPASILCIAFYSSCKCCIILCQLFHVEFHSWFQFSNYYFYNLLPSIVFLSVFVYIILNSYLLNCFRLLFCLMFSSTLL